MYEFNPTREHIIEAYNAISEQYDDIMESEWEASRFRKKIFNYLSEKNAVSILEVGIGTGLNSDYYIPNINVTGIDIASDMMKQCRAKLLRNSSENLDILEMDVEKMTFPDNSFDGVVATYVMSVVNDPAKAFKELIRVCKNRGKILLFDWVISSLSYVSHNQELVKPYCVRVGFPKPMNNEVGAIIWNPSRCLAQIGIDQGLKVIKKECVDQDDVFKSRAYIEFEVQK